MPEDAASSAFTPHTIDIHKGARETVRDFLRSLLEDGDVQAVLSLGKTGGGEPGVAYALYTDPEAFGPEGDALPLHPFMPANAGGLLSRLTMHGPVTHPVAAVVKPCELRALIELVKLNQCNLDNLVIISSTCSGVYPLSAGANGAVEERLPLYWERTRRGELDEEVRTTCRACTHFVPENADITLALLGQADIDAECTLWLHTDKGAELASGLGGTAGSLPKENEIIEQSLAQREGFREELFASSDSVVLGDGLEVGLEGLIRTFGRCIGCHGCKTVCPICYCRLCTFDSQTSEHPAAYYEDEMRRKGGLRVPPDTVYFQLGRMAHMALSCVGCGMCSDVCPADIPVSTLFSKVGAAVQAVFDYEPGRDVTEEIPLRTFEEEELTGVAT